MLVLLLLELHKLPAPSKKDFTFQLGLKEMAQYLHTGNAAKPFSIKRPSDPKP